MNNQKVGLCGFSNIGNTCYMNSTLQILIHSKVMIEFLMAKTNPYLNNSLSFVEMVKQKQINAEFVNYLENGIITRIQESERKKLNLDSNAIIQIPQNIINKKIENSFTIKLAEIINLIMYKGISHFRPDDFKRVVDLKIPDLRGFSQQDSHELLNGILDNIIEETGIETEITINNVPDSIKQYIKLLGKIKLEITTNPRHKQEILEELNNFKNSNRSIVNRYDGLNYMSQIFKTHYNPMIQKLLTFTISTVTCANESCKIESTCFGHHSMLILHMKPTLKESFNFMIEEELVDKKCQFCSHTKAIQTCRIWQPGMLLYIELSRFNNLPNGKTSKNNSSIEIPDELNISNYCDQSNNLNYQNLNYKLKGMSNHLGNINGGHYTADCVSIVDNTTWYHFDDSSVYKYNGTNVDKSSGYVLLYELEL